MRLCSNTGVKIRSTDEDRDFLVIAAGVLQAEKLAPYLFIIYLDNVLSMSIEIKEIKPTRY